MLRWSQKLLLWIPLIAVSLCMLLPVGYLLFRSISAGSEALDLIFRIQTFEILANTAMLVVVVTSLSVLIALPIGWLTVRTNVPCQQLWGVLTVLPLVIPSYVGGLVVIAALGPRGLVQNILSQVGVDRIPDIYGLPGAALTITLVGFPYVLLTIRTALWSQDPSLEQSARILGKSAIGAFFTVTLPNLRPAIAAGALLIALYTLSDFGAVSLLRFDSFTKIIYVAYESSINRNIAAVLSLVLVACAFGLIFIESCTRGKSKYYRTTAVSTKQLYKVNLGWWRWPSFVLCVLVVGASLVLPIGVLLYWLTQGSGPDYKIASVWKDSINSLYTSGLAAGVTSLVALLVVGLTLRNPGRISSLIERITFVGFALPSLVVGLSLVFFTARLVPFLYQTTVLFVAALVILFLPQAIGSIRSSFLQIPTRLEDAARGLGYSQIRVLMRITLPMVIPGMIAGAAMVFLTSMKELPAALMLSPIGFSNLPISIWSAANEALFAQAALPALLLIAVSTVPMIFLLIRQPKGMQ